MVAMLIILLCLLVLAAGASAARLPRRRLHDDAGSAGLDKGGM
jgi:hypothetical protein